MLDTGDTAWVLASAALVLIMTPGVAFFYGGMMGNKNAAATVMHSFMTIGIVGVVWVVWGYGLAFGNDLGSIGFIGDLEYGSGCGNVDAEAAGPYSRYNTRINPS